MAEIHLTCTLFPVLQNFCILYDIIAKIYTFIYQRNVKKSEREGEQSAAVFYTIRSSLQFYFNFDDKEVLIIWVRRALDICFNMIYMYSHFHRIRY